MRNGSIWAQRRAILSQQVQPVGRLKESLAAIWLILMLIVPVFGSFWPPATYFQVGGLGERQLNEATNTGLILLAVVMGAMLMLADLKYRTKLNHEIIAYFFIFLVISIAIISPGFPVVRSLRVVPPLLYGLLLVQYFNWEKSSRIFLLSFLLAAACSIIMGVFFPQYALSKYEGVYEFAWRGAMQHKNSAGIIFAFGSMFSFYMLVSRGINIWIALVSMILNLFLVYKCNSATSMLCLFVGVSAYLTMRIIQRLPIVPRLLCIFVMLLTFACGALALGAIPTLLPTILGRDATLTGRTDIWVPVWELIKERPFRGWGYSFWAFGTDAHDYVTNTVKYNAADSHNDWLELWLQLGIIGPLTIGLYFLVIIGKSISMITKQQSTVPPLVLAMILMLLTRSFSEVQFIEPSNNGIFWLVWASLALKMHCIKDNSASRNWVHSPNFLARKMHAQ